MKKYIVLTDKFNWVGDKDEPFLPGAVIYKKGDFLFSFKTGSKWGLPKNLLKDHSDWFSEIKEDELSGNTLKALYTDHDMRVFGGNVQRASDGFTSSSTIESLLSDYKTAKFSPKEETKEFTRQDMVELLTFFNYEYLQKTPRSERCMKPFSDIVDSYLKVNKIYFR